MIARSPEELREAILRVAPIYLSPFWIAEVVSKVEDAAGLKRGGLSSPRRDQQHVWARFCAVCLLREAGLSHPQIGRALRRDHSTTIHAERRAVELLESNPFFAGLYGEIRERLA